MKCYYWIVIIIFSSFCQPLWSQKITGQQLDIRVPVSLKRQRMDLSQNLKEFLKHKQGSSDLKMVQRFYEENHYQPIWFEKRRLNAFGRQALYLMRHADEEGLNPHDYQQATIVLNVQDGSIERRVKAEILLTKIFLKYMNDVINGRVSPQEASREISMRPTPVDPVAYLKKGLSSPSIEWIKNLGPPYKEYRYLKKLLKAYRHVWAHWPEIAFSDKTVIKGSNVHPDLPKIRSLLNFLGYKTRTSNPQFYDKRLEEQIRLFQQHHGLKVDGIIGPRTFKALEMSPVERIKRIIITMERWRWMPHDPGNRYILVNVPSFELKAIENRKVALKSRVIVGRPSRKTPCFKAIMRDIVFNPSWHVPVNMAVNDLLKKIRQDPSYISRHNYVLSNSQGEPVNPHHVNWEHYGKGNFPFRLRQRPGSHNALGRIKFEMKNPFAIYLHSTPNKELFNKDVRIFSSGCIRVEKVAELALFLLNDSQWTLQKIAQRMQAQSTQTVKLKEKVPVYITYFTVGCNEEGRQFFMPDIYDQDQKIARLLFGEPL